jgi:MFS family permease
MNEATQNLSATLAASIGAAGLASAMGIGRFSLTPIMPLMQHEALLTLAQGSWLATGNYVGYLIGALLCAAVAPRTVGAIRWGLLWVGVFTLAMGLTHSVALWFAFRLAAGIASAFVLVAVSAWAMPILAHQGKGHWSGRLFAGVGIGVAFAGLVGLAAAVEGWGSQTTWIVLGVIACLFALLLANPMTRKEKAALSAAPRDSGKLSRRVWIAAGCYSAFGYGYIIPATFLPSLARGYIDDPAVFGLVWPVFGLAAAISTVIAAKLLNRFSAHRLWMAAQWVLAAGVLAPVVTINVTTLSLSALCVGGSFMVITMAGIKEVLRLEGNHAARAVGVMTAGFGVGQIAGPLVVGLFAKSSGVLALPSMIAVLGLVLSNLVLYAVGEGSPIQDSR